MVNHVFNHVFVKMKQNTFENVLKTVLKELFWKRCQSSSVINARRCRCHRCQLFVGWGESSRAVISGFRLLKPLSIKYFLLTNFEKVSSFCWKMFEISPNCPLMRGVIEEFIFSKFAWSPKSSIWVALTASRLEDFGLQANLEKMNSLITPLIIGPFRDISSVFQKVLIFSQSLSRRKFNWKWL